MKAFKIMAVVALLLAVVNTYLVSLLSSTQSRLADMVLTNASQLNKNLIQQQQIDSLQDRKVELMYQYLIKTQQ